MTHEPVLLKEVIEVLSPKKGEFFIDGTVDGGGHAREILKKISPGGKLLGIDWDKRMIDERRKELAGRNDVILENDNYTNMVDILKKKKLGKADGILLDLGFSSEQLESSGRGFSFRRNEPLLMTYSADQKPAHQILREYSEKKIAEIIKDFGEERFAVRIAKAIKKNLPILTSKKLADVIARAVPANYEHGRIHPATRTFQALRIFVNRELDNLRQFLEIVLQVMNPGARLAIISFHSLEDRIVKKEFREWRQEGFVEILTKKPITASIEEKKSNPRSRSAKLRAIKVVSANINSHRYYDHN
ncbi:MAG TPA: 16S rRNA (cytosine(1402)-N(4))-methyltransferase RsmH [Candidatus Paceibacterota bacterium]|nr:16S rRNA (cytosine(1402)-N(4))-methyltransferase RsmH [Candidatus Paceibacterota bacterium]